MDLLRIVEHLIFNTEQGNDIILLGIGDIKSYVHFCTDKLLIELKGSKNIWLIEYNSEHIRSQKTNSETFEEFLHILN